MRWKIRRGCCSKSKKHEPPRPPRAPRRSKAEMLVPTVTCYCDIPYGQLGPHISKYGSFGLSFSRHYLTKVGARPVIYVPCRPDDWRGVFTGYTLLKELEATFVGVQEQRAALSPDTNGKHTGVGLETRPKSASEALEKTEHTLALRVLAFIKPYESTLDESDPNYYYSEREWRKLGNLMFEPSDVLRVVVHHSFLARVREEFPAFRDRLCSLPE